MDEMCWCEALRMDGDNRDVLAGVLPCDTSTGAGPGLLNGLKMLGLREEETEGSELSPRAVWLWVVL